MTDAAPADGRGRARRARSSPRSGWHDGRRGDRRDALAAPGRPRPSVVVAATLTHGADHPRAAPRPRRGAARARAGCRRPAPIRSRRGIRRRRGGERSRRGTPRRGPPRTRVVGSTRRRCRRGRPRRAARRRSRARRRRRRCAPRGRAPGRAVHASQSGVPGSSAKACTSMPVRTSARAGDGCRAPLDREHGGRRVIAHGRSATSCSARCRSAGT